MVDTVGSNPITGDRLVTKPSEKYTSNYDQIFRKKSEPVKEEKVKDETTTK
jgi:hypothetical protein